MIKNISMNPKNIFTPIQGLRIRLEKAKYEHTGFSGEMIPSGVGHPFFKSIHDVRVFGVEGKHVLWGGRSHTSRDVSLFVISGLALMVFRDMSKDSPTHSKVWHGVFGRKRDEDDFPIDQKHTFVLPKNMAHIRIPRNVMYALWPLNEIPVSIVEVSADKYDSFDTKKHDPYEYDGLDAIAEKFNIK